MEEDKTARPDLDGCRNPCSLSKVLCSEALPSERVIITTRLELSHNISKGVTDEPFSKAITDDLASQYRIAWTPKYRYRILTGKSC